MKKSLLALMLVSVLAVLFTGCSLDKRIGDATTTEYAPAVSHTEAEIVAVMKSYDSVSKKYTFIDCMTNQEVGLIYSAGVNFYNAHGDIVSKSEVNFGTVVDVKYYTDTRKIVSITVDPSAKVIKNVDKFVGHIDEQKGVYNGQTVQLAEFCKVYDGDDVFTVDQVNTEDLVRLNTYGGKVVSIIIEKGHGYVRLENHYSYKGGMVEIGYGVIVPVTDDMLLAVREGEYTLRISKNGYKAEKNVIVIKNTERVVDLSDITIPSGTATFEVIPADAAIYIDGNKIDGYTYTNIYGTYKFSVQKEGYKTYSGSYTINDTVKNISVTLTELKKEETTEEDSKTTETEQTTETTTESTTTERVSTGNKVYVNTPAGASVYVDGDFVGTAPVFFDKTLGTHTITLYKTGYLIKSYTIECTNTGADDNYNFSDLTSLTDALDNTEN